MLSTKFCVFVSSPGDVEEERVIAERILRRLADRFAGVVTVKWVFWEHEPLAATDTFQAQIPPTSDSDVVICILWARLGTRLPAKITRPDGTPYESGTEYEFETAAEAFHQKGVPDLLVYRKTADATVSLKDEAQLLERLRQKRLLDAFVDRWFHGPDGTLVAAFHPFQDTAQFEELLEVHLRKLIERRLEAAAIVHDGGGALAGVPPTWTAGSPFRGLEVFELEHAPIFFGRTRAVSEVLAALRKQAEDGRAFLLILGASGCGKSSLVRAGVLPLLTQPGVIEEVGLWRSAIVRPGGASGDLFHRLAAALKGETALPELVADGTTETELARLLRDNPRSADPLVKGALSHAASHLEAVSGAGGPLKARLALIVDQLEEIFTDEQITPGERTGFVEALGALARSGRAWVIATLRIDFYPLYASLPELMELKRGHGQYDLAPPNPAEIAQIIRRPAEAAGLRFEVHAESGASLDDLLRDAAADPASLPLLEFTLDELYKLKSDSHMLTHAAYKQLGGVEGALATQADKVFGALSEPVRAALPRVLRLLVRLGGGEPGEPEVPILRIAPLDRLRATPELATLTDALIAARLLTTDQDDQGHSVVRVTHAALLTQWHPVVEWLDHYRELLRFQSRVTAGASRWDNEGRRPDLLLPEGKPLDEGRALLRSWGDELAEYEREFLTRSLQRAQRNRRLKQRATAGALALVAASILLGAGAWVFYRDRQAAQTVATAEAARADAQTKLADEQRRIAQSLPLIDNAALARDEGFQQGEARYLAEALQIRDDPTQRIRWLEAIQRALVPVQTSSRRLMIGCLAFSRDGKWLASGDISGTRPAIRIWDMDRQVVTRLLHGHTTPETPQALSAIRRLVFRSDRPDQLISAGLDGTVRLWDLAAGIEAARYPPEGKPPLPQVLALDATKSGGHCRIVTGDLTGKLTWFDLVAEPTGRGSRFVKVAEAGGHKPKVTAVAFHPAGAQAASVGEDGVVRLWDSTGKLQAELIRPDLKPGQPDHHLNSVAYSPDGTLLCAASKDGKVLVWDVAARRLARMLLGHEAGPDGRNWVMRLDFPTPTRLFSAGMDGTIREWDPTTGRATAVRGRHDRTLLNESAVAAVAAAPVGRGLASAGADGAIRLWDLDTGRLTAELEGCMAGSMFSCTACASLPGKDLLITAGAARDSLVRAWDMSSLREKQTYVQGVRLEADKLPSALPVTLAIAPDGSKFVTGDVGGDLIVWNTETGKRLATIEKAHSFPTGLGSAVTSIRQRGLVATLDSLKRFASMPFKLGVLGLAWSGDGRRFVSVGTDRLVKLWDAETKKQLASWSNDDPDWPETEPFSEMVPNTLAILFDREGKHLIVPALDRLVRIREVESGKIVARLTGHTEPVMVSVLNTGGTLLATASADGRVIVWDTASRRPLRSFEVKPLLDGGRFGGPTGPSSPLLRAGLRRYFRVVSSLAFSPDSRLLAVGQADSSVSLVELARGEVLQRGIGHEPSTPPWGYVYCFFTSDGLLVTVGSDGAIRRWDLAARNDGTKVVERLKEDGANRIAVSPDGQEWAIVIDFRLIRWNQATGAELGQWFMPEGDAPRALAYSPVGGRLVVGCFRGKGVVLDRATGRNLAVFQAPKTPSLFGGRDLDVITTVAVDPSGELAATNRNDDHIDLWTLDGARLVKSLSTGGGRACRLAFRPRGARHLAASDDRGRLIVWDLENFKPIFDLTEGPPQTASTGDLAYSPDGSLLVQVGMGEEAAVWDAASGRRVQSLPGHTAVAVGAESPPVINSGAMISGVAFSPDGTLMATCGWDGTIRLWDARNRDAFQPVAVRATSRLTSYEGVRPLNPILQAKAMLLLSWYRLREARPPMGLAGQPKQPEGKDLLASHWTEGLNCVAFSHDGKHILTAGNGTDGHGPPLLIIDVEALRAPINRARPAAEIFAETERLTGLEMRSDGLKPIDSNRLVPPRDRQR
jgi:WD40 repeat protein